MLNGFRSWCSKCCEREITLILRRFYYIENKQVYAFKFSTVFLFHVKIVQLMYVVSVAVISIYILLFCNAFKSLFN